MQMWATVLAAAAVCEVVASAWIGYNDTYIWLDPFLKCKPCPQCPEVCPVQCPTAEPSECPQPVSNVDCKKRYFVAKKKVTWFDAVKGCREAGLQLLTIPDREVWGDVQKFIEETGIENDYWTSGAYLDELMWTATWTALDFTYWDRWQPDNKNMNEHCIHIKRETLMWNDIDCNVKMFYICEKCID